MANREIFDYVDARGGNVIETWLAGFSRERPKVEARLDATLRYIRIVDRIRDDWMEKLEGGNDDIYEIKLEYRNVQYRLLSAYGPERHQITMLLPAIEQNDRLRPPSARATAYERSQYINLPRRVILHE